MLVIRQQQMDAFRKSALVDFETEMVAHSKEFSPKLSKVLGDEQLKVAVRQTLARAEAFGFTNRGPIRLMIEMMFLFGSAFDTDPQYPWAGSILRGEGEQMERAEKLYERILDYQENVSGPDAANTRRALKDLSELTQRPLPFTATDFEGTVLKEMERVFPEKTAYVGPEALKTLIAQGVDEARQHGFPRVRGEALLVVMKFAFGHGCTRDPLYPWIVNTLKDDKIVDGAARADRLERKAMTWLEHVVASFG